jgi:hypothetical protein
MFIDAEKLKIAPIKIKNFHPAPAVLRAGGRSTLMEKPGLREI